MHSHQTTNFANLTAGHARLQPSALAIEDGDRSLTYGQLELAINRLAAALVQGGFVKGERAILFAGKNVASIVIILGIVKAGGVYVPVDREIPAARLQLIMDETRPALFFEDADTAVPELLAGCTLVSRSTVSAIIEDKTAETTQDPLLPDVALDADDLCYIMYTSGSTGRPKGVPISHGNFSAYMESIEPVFVMSGRSRCMNTLPFNFDGSIVDTFFPLYRGASLYITPALPMPGLLTNILLQKKITHFTASASILNLLYQYLQGKDVALSHLEMIMTGADVCDKKVIHFFLAVNPGVRVINGYGPTEATCDALTYTISQPSEDLSGYFPIGKPLKNIIALLKTETGDLTDAPGSQGQLLLSGKQLFKGYLQRPEESRKALEVIDGALFYHTGDSCSIDREGDFCFLGRVDEEFKLNGYRIHPNEVRQALLRLPEVKSSEIIVASTNNEKLLTAAVVLSPEGNGEVLKGLPRRLGPLLPSFMIPRVFAEYRDFPLNSNMKVDRKKVQLDIEAKLMHANGSFFSMIGDKP